MPCDAHPDGCPRGAHNVIGADSVGFYVGGSQAPAVEYVEGSVVERPRVRIDEPEQPAEPIQPEVEPVVEPEQPVAEFPEPPADEQKLEAEPSGEPSQEAN